MKTQKMPQNKADYPECRGSLETLRFPAFVDIKYDGEFNLYRKEAFNAGGYLVNKYGLCRLAGTITNVLDEIFENQIVVLAGELTVNDGRKGQLYQLLSNKASDDLLKFYVFDIQSYIVVDNHMVIDLTTPLIDRREVLSSILSGQYGCVRLVETFVASDREETQNIFEQVKGMNYEGVVAKAFDAPYQTGPCGWVKIKDKDESVYKVAAIDPVKDRIEIEVICDDGFHRNVGVKVSGKTKACLQTGDRVIVQHQGILSHGGLRHPVLIGRSKEEEDEINGDRRTA